MNPTTMECSIIPALDRQSTNRIIHGPSHLVHLLDGANRDIVSIRSYMLNRSIILPFPIAHHLPTARNNRQEQFRSSSLCQALSPLQCRDLPNLKPPSHLPCPHLIGPRLISRLDLWRPPRRKQFFHRGQLETARKHKQVADKMSLVEHARGPAHPAIGLQGARLSILRTGIGR
jgi:hypothetical protein